MSDVCQLGKVLMIRTVSGLSSPSDSPEAARYTCPSCGTVVEPFRIEIGGRVKFIRRRCACELKKFEAQELRLKVADRQLKIDRLFALSELGPRFKDSTFENWEVKPGTEKCLRAARDFAEHFDQYEEEGQGLLLYGPQGNGKSHLAGAIINHLIRLDRPRVCIFHSVPALLRKLKDTIDGGVRYKASDVYQAIRESDLLVLDDFGAEQGQPTYTDAGRVITLTPWAETTLYEILDEQYRWKKPLVITSNLGLKELQTRVGMRIFDRLLDMVMPIRNEGKSFRQERALKRLGRSA